MTRAVDRPLGRNPRFTRLVLAKISNELSTAIGNVALPLLVLLLTGSALLTGAALFLLSASTIAMQCFGGAIVDRIGASRALRGSSWLQAAGWAIVLASVLLPGPLQPCLVVGAVVTGAASGLDGPAEHSLLKAVVPREQIGSAAAVSQGREAVAEVGGGPIGGVLFGVLPVLPVLVQMGLHVVAAVSAPRIRFERSAAAAGESFFAAVVDGYRRVFATPALRGIAVVAGIANLPVAMLPLTLLIHYRESGLAPGLIGLCAAAFGVGIVLGALPAGPLASRMRLGTLGAVALSAFAAGQAGVLLSFEDYRITCVVLALSALPLPAFNAAIGAYTMTVTPPDLVGRVTAASGVPAMLLMPVGVLLAGLVTERFGAAVAIGLSAAVAMLAAAVMLVDRSLRTMPRIAELTEG